MRITIIGHGFKEQRFLQVHRKAIRFPEDKMAYIGVNPPNLKDAVRGELANLQLLESDPYGATSDALLDKKRQRNPFRRQHGYESSCPEVLPLMKHSSQGWYSGPVPWPPS